MGRSLVTAGAAIPLGCFSSADSFNIGTGFLGSSGDDVSLYTAAHTPTRAQPVSNWLTWPDQMLIIPFPNTAMAVPLFHAIGGVRTPTFRYLSVDGTAQIHDMMAFSMKDHPAMIEALTLQFPVQDLINAKHALTPGEKLTIFGFPDRGGKSVWPYSPAASATGPLVKGNGGAFEADLVPIHGQSGGPTFDEKGQFVGMVIGTTDGLARIVSAFSLLQL